MVKKSKKGFQDPLTIYDYIFTGLFEGEKKLRLSDCIIEEIEEIDGT